MRFNYLHIESTSLHALYFNTSNAYYVKLRLSSCACHWGLRKCVGNVLTMRGWWRATLMVWLVSTRGRIPSVCTRIATGILWILLLMTQLRTSKFSLERKACFIWLSLRLAIYLTLNVTSSLNSFVIYAPNYDACNTTSFKSSDEYYFREIIFSSRAREDLPSY